jgi:hypothetical protein
VPDRDLDLSYWLGESFGTRATVEGHLMKKRYWPVVLALLGCEDPTRVDLVEATAPIDGLQLTAVVIPSTFQAGAFTRVTVTLRNEGTHTWSVSDKLCRDAFEISTPNAEVVRPPEHHICTLEVRPPVRLDPSSQIEYKGTWTGGTSAAGPLSPGSYLVGGAVYAFRNLSFGRVRRLELRGGWTSFHITE